MKALAELVEHEIHRSRAYRILADAFLPPAPELSGVIVDLELVLARLDSSAQDAAVKLLQHLRNLDSVEPLKIDYSRLFLGPFIHFAPPYGSIYLEDGRRIMGESTANARNHYLELGLDITEDFKQAPDHICAELEFMHALVCREIDAIRSGNGDQMMESLYRQHAFLKNHLGAWIPDFTAQVIKHAEMQFYRLLGEVVQRFIAEERAMMDIQAQGEKPQERSVRLLITAGWKTQRRVFDEFRRLAAQIRFSGTCPKTPLKEDVIRCAPSKPCWNRRRPRTATYAPDRPSASEWRCWDAGSSA